MIGKPKPDYIHGCPLCGVRHHAGSTMGFSRMNRRCARRWIKMSRDKKESIIERNRRSAE